MRSLVIEIIFTRWSRIVGDLDLSRVGSLEIGAMSTWDEDSFRGDVGDAMLGAIVVVMGGGGGQSGVGGVVVSLVTFAAAAALSSFCRQ